MVLIELTGVPCAGKTFVRPKLLLRFGATLCDHTWVERQLGLERQPTLIRAIRRELWAARTGAAKLGRRRVLALGLAIMRSGWSSWRKANVFRNVLAKYAINHLTLKTADAVMLIDEGVTHIPFIFATSAAPFPEDLIMGCSHRPPDRIIKVTCRPDTLRQRLSERGHNMVGGSGRTIEEFVRLNQVASAMQDRAFRDQAIQDVMYISGED